MIELDPKAMHPTQKRKNKREGRESSTSLSQVQKVYN